MRWRLPVMAGTQAEMKTPSLAVAVTKLGLFAGFDWRINPGFINQPDGRSCNGSGCRTDATDQKGCV
jgi:hypothetical protein